MLEGPRIRLRAVEWDDLPYIVQWLNDPSVTEHLLSSQMEGLSEQEMWYESIQNGKDRVMSIETKDCILIGDCGINRLEWEDRRVNIWLMIGNKEYWDKGYGTEVVQIMLDYIFGELNMDRISLNCRRGQ